MKTYYSKMAYSKTLWCAIQNKCKKVANFKLWLSKLQRRSAVSAPTVSFVTATTTIKTTKSIQHNYNWHNRRCLRCHFIATQSWRPLSVMHQCWIRAVPYVKDFQWSIFRLYICRLFKLISITILCALSRFDCYLLFAVLY